MKRLIAVGLGLVCGGAALAADPVNTSPAATLRPVGTTDVAQPLPAAVTAALPPDAGYPGPAACGGEDCPGGTCATDDRTCLGKLKDWFCYRPGPRVLPLFTPTQYHAPLRQFFPCQPGQCLVVGGCNPGAGCASNVSGQTFPDVISYYMPRPPIIGPIPAQQAVPPAPIAPRPGAAPTPTPMPTSQAVPSSVGATQTQTPARATRPRFRDRVKGVFSSMWSDTVPFQTPGSTAGPTVVPVPPGLRFATPGVQQPGNGAHGEMIQTGHLQPSANQPLTRQ